METLSPISKRISLLLRKSHKRPHLSVGYFTKKMGICQGLFLAGTGPRTGTFVLFYLLIHCRLCRLPVAPAKLSARCSARDLAARGCLHCRYYMKRNLSALQGAALA